MELASRVYACFTKIRPHCSGVRTSFDVSNKYSKMKTRSRNVTGETVQHRQSNKGALLTRRFTVYHPILLPGRRVGGGTTMCIVDVVPQHIHNDKK